MGLKNMILLIPHYNDLIGLRKSLSSLPEGLDVLIVDDGSSEKPSAKELSDSFPSLNIELIYLPENRGIEHALNAGLRRILSLSYRYIARLDAGDEVVPKRFEVQLEHMRSNPDLFLLGTWGEAVDPDTHKVIFKLTPPTDYRSIRKAICLNSPFIHTSVMFRREVVEEVGFYPIGYKYAEDYAFFFKIVKRFKAKNLPTFMVRFELNPRGVSISKRRRQIISRLKVIYDNRSFSPMCYWGLIRNAILLGVPYGMINLIKSLKSRICSDTREI